MAADTELTEETPETGPETAPETGPDTLPLTAPFVTSDAGGSGSGVIVTCSGMGRHGVRRGGKRGDAAAKVD